ncbi:hypothetical protein [Thalassoglobus sp.]|uniref:hypothetical protein n=1 Tax=Thalassoglobus sp. TaxID=2795869 RepID=UPI003AA944DD
MRFQKDTTPPPYLNRRDQYRMLGLFGMLMLIVVSIDFTRKPENWHWFFSIGEEPVEVELKELSLDELDFQVLDEDRGTLPPDTFVAVADEPTIQLDELGFNIKQIPSELLESVQDKRVGLLRSEQDAMDRVLKRVRALNQDELLDAADSEIGFRVVFTDSEKYRGRLIEVEGTLWRLQPYPFGDPDSTEDDLWQAWFFSSDSGKNPWVVFFAEKPDEVEAGEGINRQIQTAGYFFKNYGYATEQGLHIAPMLIAKTLVVKPLPPATDATTENLNLYVFIFMITIGVLFGLMIWWFVRSDRKFDKSHLAEIAESRHDASPEFITSLSEQAPNDPNQLVLPKGTEEEK